MKTEPTFIVRPHTSEQAKALKAFIKALKIDFKISDEKESTYNQKFVEKVRRGEKDIREGKGTVIKTEDLWK